MEYGRGLPAVAGANPPESTTRIALIPVGSRTVMLPARAG